VAVVFESIDGDYLDVITRLTRIRRDVEHRIEPVALEELNDQSGFLKEITKSGVIIADPPERYSAGFVYRFLDPPDCLPVCLCISAHYCPKSVFQSANRLAIEKNPPYRAWFATSSG